MIKRPGQYPDILIFPGDTSKTWTFPMQRNGIPWDVSAETLTATVLNDDDQIGTATVHTTQAVDGILTMSIDSTVIGKLGRYSTWRLYIAPDYATVILQGRFVMQK